MGNGPVEEARKPQAAAADQQAVPCPKPVYIGTGTASGADILTLAQFRAGEIPAAQKSAIDDAMADAYNAAAKAAKDVAQPECDPCKPVLLVLFRSSEIKNYDMKTLPDDAPSKAKEKAQEYGVDKIYTIYVATVTWVAWWVCKNGIPKKPPDNPGPADGVPSGGEELHLPCPHPFLSGAATFDRIIHQSELHPDTFANFEAAKPTLDSEAETKVAKKTAEEVRDAIRKLSACPPCCPQSGPTGVQIGPKEQSNKASHGGPAGAGDETYEVKYVYHWSVERNCKAPS